MTKRSFLFPLLILLLGLAACQSGQETTSSDTQAQAPAMGLHEATFMGDAPAVAAHIAAGTDLNVKDEYGSTPLQVAATFGKTEVAKLLIEGGADLNVRNNDGSTPLHTAAFLCRKDIVEALLAAGADTRQRNNFGATALESVSGPFPDVKMVYDEMSKALGPFGLKLDYDYLQTTRPLIAEMIQANGQ